VSGVVVLDIDPRNDGDASLRELDELGEPVPPTVETLTGGGGRHLWFRHPGGSISSRPLRPGVDVKGEGGLVVIPPSLHQSGQRYRWKPGRSPHEHALAGTPWWLIGRTGAAGDATHRGLGGSPVTRTAAEQNEFADAWQALGIDLRPGDRMYLCPFHPDHHPSLHIDTDGCRWFCFGCHEGGGIGRLRHLLGEPTGSTDRTRLVEDRLDERVNLPGHEPVDVVGESLHQDALLALTGGERHYGGVDVVAVAHLVPERDEPSSPIGVVIEGELVGRVSDEEVPWVRAIVDRAIGTQGVATCRARIRGGWDRGHDDLGFFGVTLEVGTTP
jgi:hypothetical protein